ncbi:MAG: NAD(P)/FAD-dependent oxidoreductase [Breznakibacter sp.]|nr:NAD(P)/FAD-dependent oxidoreductase [Breznakibacter sp.]
MTNIKNFDYIIIGAGITGTTAAETISSLSRDSSVLLINNEPRLPYKRTKINKSIHSGFHTDDFALKSKAWFAEKNITLIAENVESIHTESKTISTGDQTFTYGKLLLAMGCRPRCTGNKAWDRMVMPVRTATEVEVIIESMQKANHYLIIGGGAEGIETAEQLVRAGKRVTLTDRNLHLMHRYLTEELSNRVKNTLMKNGISVINPTEIIAIHQNQEYTIELNGQTITADAIISCIGHQPNMELALNAGIKTNRGIVVDKTLQTSSPEVFAAGDVAEHPDGHITGLWHAAEYQGKIAAMNMAGIHTICENRPYRFKTEVFGDFYFSGGTLKQPGATITQTGTANKVRMMAIANNQILGIVSLNEALLAPLYQQALMEHWTPDQLELAINKLAQE